MDVESIEQSYTIEERNAQWLMPVFPGLGRLIHKDEFLYKSSGAAWKTKKNASFKNR